MRIAAAALALALMTGMAAAAPPPEEPPLEERLFRAFYQENGIRDFAKGAELYGEVAAAARAAKDEGTLLKALLGRGRCLRTLGRADEAKAEFRAALDVDPACDEAARALVEADAAPDGIEEELRQRITALVWKLGGAEREQATADLRRIGARAVPFLEEGLRTADVGIVTGAAAILADLPAPGARGALARAIQDPKVAFPDVVRQAAGGIPFGGQDADRPGRYALLRAVVLLEDRGRLSLLNQVLSRGFANAPEEELAPVLKDLLARADDEQKLYLLNTFLGASTHVLLPTALAFLATGESDRVRAALSTLGNLKDLPPEAVAALRGVLESGSPYHRFVAFRLLQGREVLSDEETSRAVNRLLAAEDLPAVQGAVEWIRTTSPGQGGTGLRWDPAWREGLLAGLRSAIPGAETDNGARVSSYHGILAAALPALPVEDVADLLGLCDSNPGTAQVSNLFQLLRGEVTRRAGSNQDAAGSGRDLLAGLRSLRGRALGLWVQAWANRGTALEPGVRFAVAAHPDPAVRNWGYQWILPLVKEGGAPLPPEIVARVAEDLPGSGMNTNAPVWQLAWASRDPALAPALRGMAEGAVNAGAMAAPLQLLAACAGKEAAPDFRSALERTGYEQSWMLDTLLKLAGKEAVPELRAWLAKHPQGEPGKPTNYLEALAFLDGKGAVPDLRESLARHYNEGILMLLAGALGKEAVPDLRKALVSQRSAWARARLVDALGAEAAPDLVAAVEANAAMGDPRWVICNSITNPSTARSLSVPAEVATAFFARLPEGLRTGRLLQQVSFAMPPDTRSAFVNGYLDDARPEMVAAAAWVVRRFNMVEFWPRLLPLLDHSDEEVRREAKEALDSIRNYRELKESFERYGMEGSRKALDDASALAKDADPVKRRGAALALGALGDASGVPLLLALLDDRDPEVRAAALSALERLGGR